MARLTPEARFLGREFDERKAADPRYTRGAFARDLGLSPSMLCHVLKGSKRLSTESALRIATSVPWTRRRREAFVRSVRERQTQDGADDALSPGRETTLAAEAFASVAQWEHGALLELLRLRAVGGQTDELARLLGLAPSRAREALQRLAVLGFVQTRQGRWTRADVGHVRVPDVPSAAVRDFHKGMLDKAWDAIENVEPDARDCTGVVVATSPERIAGAKALVARFRRELRTYLEDCEPTVLYHLAVQLFPLSAVAAPSSPHATQD